MFQGNIGDTTTDQAPQVLVDGSAGTVTITVVAGSTGTLTVKQYADDPSTTTVAPGNTTTVTGTALVSCPGGIASVTMTGGPY